MGPCWSGFGTSPSSRTSFCGAPMPPSIAAPLGSGTIGRWKCTACRGEQYPGRASAASGCGNPATSLRRVFACPLRETPTHCRSPNTKGPPCVHNLLVSGPEDRVTPCSPGTVTPHAEVRYALSPPDAPAESGLRDDDGGPPITRQVRAAVARDPDRVVH